MQPAYRQLAPAPPNQIPRPHDSEPRKRKKKARLACNHCRLKRIGCDGTRPECARCLKARVPCVYLSENAEATPTMVLKSEVENLQRQLQEHTDFLETIRKAPEDDMLNILHQLRTADSASAVLSLYQHRVAASNGTSVHCLAQAATSSTESGIEYELSACHPTAYPIFESTSPSSTASPLFAGDSSQTPSSDRTPPLSTDFYTYCDPRLDDLTVAYWTRIPIDDGLAARAISHFLTTDHPILGFFDADLFLQDLVNQSLDFCSSFLFHAVMSLACQSYRAENLQISSYCQPFIDEALKLWHAERSTDSTATLAALNCLSVAVGWDGINELGNHQLVADARAMAMRMHLLDVAPTHASMDAFNLLNEKEMRDHAYVAWGSYGWQSLCASFFPKPAIRFPPNFTIPGDKLDTLATFDSLTPAPDHRDLTFAAMSQLWVIVQEILAVYNLQDESPLLDRAIPSFAEAKYQKLLAWAGTLRKELRNDKDSASYVYLLHAFLHTTILNLFRPFLAPPTTIRLRSFSSPNSTSLGAFSASVKQLKRLLYNYRTHVPHHLARSALFNPAVLHLSSILVQQSATDPSWRFFFRLCLDYWKDAYVCFRVFASIVPAHLSLAIQAGALDPKEAKALNDEVLAVGAHHGYVLGVGSDAYVDFHRAIRGLDGATVRELAERFEEQMVFEDFMQEFGEPV